MNEHYYARDVDIVSLLFVERRPGWMIVSDEMPWGLVHYDEETGKAVGVEVWEASKRLPKAMLDALPDPEDRRSFSNENTPRADSAAVTGPGVSR